MASERTLIESIRIQWEDLHHSRRQVWQALVVVAGIFAALGQLGKTRLDLVAYLAFAGALVSVIAASICWQHRTIMIHKISDIRRLETMLGLPPYPRRGPHIPVQMLMFLLFGVTTSSFIAIALVAVTDVGYLSSPILKLITTIVIVAIAGIVMIIFYLFVQNRATVDDEERKRALVPSIEVPRVPLYAELDKLEAGLNLLGETPIKLIVDSLLKNSQIEEEAWLEGEWDFSKDKEGPRVRRRVWVNALDTFQFSVAGESSRQHSHVHTHVFEIYVSQTPMVLHYGPPGSEDTSEILRVDGGAILVPPRIPHRLTLEGLTFVFQVSTSCGPVGDDKTKFELGVEQPAAADAEDPRS